MPALNYRFTFLYYREPSIEVAVSAPSLTVPVTSFAFIDTGAEVSLFDLSIANELGVNVADSPTVNISGVGGLVRQAVLLEVTFELLCEPELSVTIPIAFAPEVEQLYGNLLGLDVLEHFDFALSHSKRTGYLQHVDS